MKASNKAIAILACLIMLSMPLMVMSDIDSEATRHPTVIYEGHSRTTTDEVLGPVHPPEPSKTGYTFDYWVCEGVKFYANKTDTLFRVYKVIPNEVTMKPVWTANKYTATFVDGSSTVSTKRCTFDSQIGDMPTVSKAGYNFLGWSSNGSTSGIVSSATPYTFAGDHTFVAMWKEATFNIKLIDNGETYGTIQRAYKSQMGDLPVLSKEGYSFVGWSFNREGTQMVNSTTIFDRTQDTELYAVWTSSIYSITFVNNGADFGTKTVSYGSIIGDMPVPVAIGKEFVGWSLDGTEGTIVTSDMHYNFKCNIRLFAVYKDIEYTVSFDANGGNSTPSPIKCKYNAAFGELPTCARDGKIFKGWSLTQDGTSLVTSDSVLNQANDVTLYAVWADADSGRSTDNSIGLSFDNPLSIAALVIVIGATIGISVWVYRKGSL